MAIHPGQLYNMMVNHNRVRFHSGYPVSTINHITQIPARADWDAAADYTTSRINTPTSTMIIQAPQDIPSIRAISIGPSTEGIYYASFELPSPLAPLSAGENFEIQANSFWYDYSLSPVDQVSGLRDGWQETYGSNLTGLNWSGSNVSVAASLGRGFFTSNTTSTHSNTNNQRFSVYIGLHADHPLSTAGLTHLVAPQFHRFNIETTGSEIGFSFFNDATFNFPSTATPAYMSLLQTPSGVGTHLVPTHLVMAAPITNAVEIESGNNLIVPAGTSLFRIPEAT